MIAGSSESEGRTLAIPSGAMPRTLTLDDLHREPGLVASLPRQVRHGYDPDIGFDDANRLLGALAANGWRRPVKVLA